MKNLLILFLGVTLGGCASPTAVVMTDAETCHVHITNAIHGQPTCTARVVAADYVATHDPACLAVGVKPIWNCDNVDP